MKHWNLVAILFIIVIITGFTTCDSGNESNSIHTHSYGNWTTKTEATCTEAKVEKRICSCGEEEIQNVGEPLGHNIGNWTQKTQANCENDKLEEGVCTRENCFETISRTVAGTSLGHNYSNWTQKTPATCKNDEVEESICTRENCSEVDNRIVSGTALGHDWNGWEINTNSISKKTCSRCTLKTNGEIGDIGPEGGKIFYIDPKGFIMMDDNSTAYYLEASPVSLINEASSLPLGFHWSSGWYEGNQEFVNYIFNTSDNIGAGRSNTALILSIDENAPAALACINYGESNDWFLPSINELYQLYLNRNIFDNLITGDEEYVQYTEYWSSSQSSSVEWAAFYQGFTDNAGSGGGNAKHNLLRVRAVHAF